MLASVAGHRSTNRHWPADAHGGEEGVHRIKARIEVMGTASANPPIRRFSSTVKFGKILRPSGTCCTPIRATASGESEWMICPSIRIPGYWAEKSGDRPKERGLTCSICPDEGYDLARVNGERHILERSNASVMNDELLNLQHRRTPPPEVCVEDTLVHPDMSGVR